MMSAILALCILIGSTIFLFFMEKCNPRMRIPDVTCSKMLGAFVDSYDLQPLTRTSDSMPPDDDLELLCVLDVGAYLPTFYRSINVMMMLALKNNNDTVPVLAKFDKVKLLDACDTAMVEMYYFERPHKKTLMTMLDSKVPPESLEVLIEYKGHQSRYRAVRQHRD